MQEVQSVTMGCLCNEAGTSNLGLLIVPMFTYKKGTLYVQEAISLKMIAQKNCNIDKKFSLNFKKKTDSRDSRPLVYEGRIVIGHGQQFAIEDTIFAGTHLVSESGTEKAEMLAGSSMTVIENLDEEALPDTTEDRGHVAISENSSNWACLPWRSYSKQFFPTCPPKPGRPFYGWISTCTLVTRSKLGSQRGSNVIYRFSSGAFVMTRSASSSTGTWRLRRLQSSLRQES